MPKLVFSQTLDRAPWGTWTEATMVTTNAGEERATLNQQRGQDLVLWRSIARAQSRMHDRLSDE